MARESLTVEPAAGEAGDSVAAGAYRPHLDGLRALAVYLVVFFHAGSSWFSGGYVGVDVFFVLSGYLVTQLLLRDLSRDGSVRFSRFYARRLRRLLPAAFVVLIVTGLVYTAIASPDEVANAVGSFKAAFLYVTNWYFIHHSSDYFGPDINANPVVQFWSLAVEEQFYLIWPLALGGAFYVTRRLDRGRQLRTIRWAVAIGAVASAVWALSLRSSNPTRAYYGTDARAYELLAGALLALLPGLVAVARSRRSATRIVPVACVLLVLLLASQWISSGPIVRGIGVTIVTCALLLTLEAATGGIVKRALSTAPMVYLGKISYGTYLWHWIVIIVLVRSFHLSTLTTIAIAGLVATALASLSFEMLEHPIRIAPFLDRHRPSVIAAGLLISVGSALVIIPKVVDPADAATGALRGSAVAERLTPIPQRLNVERAGDVPTDHGCPIKVGAACTLRKGTNGHVLLIGDSQVASFSPMLWDVAQGENLTFSRLWYPACPWQQHLFNAFSAAGCKQAKDDLYQDALRELDPDLVIVVELDYTEPGPIGSGFLDRKGKLAEFSTVEQETRSSLAALRDRGRRVLLIEPPPGSVLPTPRFNPLSCLANARWAEDCRYTTRSDASRVQLLYRQLADGTDVRSVDLAPMICPLFPVCDPIIDGRLVKRDPSHLAPQFAETLAPRFDAYLRAWTATAVLPRRAAR